MTPEPEVPSPPAPAPIVAPVPVAMEAAAPPWCPQDRVEVTRIERGGRQELPQPMATGLPKKGTKPLSPMQVVTEAQKAARVEPSERGYLGGSGEHVYRWMPGKVYTVYVTKTHGTGIFLPPGERLVSGLYLDGEAYEVKTERAGIEPNAYDALTIRPLTDSGEVDAFLLTESGRRYLLHVVVGKAGMLAVTFEGPLVTQTRAPAPALVLPRPPQ